MNVTYRQQRTVIVKMHNLKNISRILVILIAIFSSLIFTFVSKKILFPKSDLRQIISDINLLE